MTTRTIQPRLLGQLAKSAGRGPCRTVHAPVFTGLRRSQDGTISTTQQPLAGSSGTFRGLASGAPQVNVTNPSAFPPPAAHAKKTEEGPAVVRNGKALVFKQDPFVPSALWNKSFPILFLRDSCHSAHSLHPPSKQRIFRTSDIPADIEPRSFGIDQDPTFGQSLKIVWNKPLRGREGIASAEEFESVIPLAFLVDHSSTDNWRSLHSIDLHEPIVWGLDEFTNTKSSSLSPLLSSSPVPNRPLSSPIPYPEFVESKELQYEAVLQLLKYGLVFFRDVPSGLDSGDVGKETLRLAELMGEIRRTWYGDKSWDVRSIVKSTNIASTDLDLGLHGDLVHFQNPPRIQMLHMILNTGVEGGASYFVDGYSISERLRRESPDDWNTLVNERVSFEYRNDGHWTRWEHPTIELEPSGVGLNSTSSSALPPYYAINYSPPFQAPLLLHRDSNAADEARIERLHRALQKFADYTDRKDIRYEVQLNEGDVALFDNRRVLHARYAFRWSSAHANRSDAEMQTSREAGRWLKGLYLEGESVWDRSRVLKEALGA